MHHTHLICRFRSLNQATPLLLHHTKGNRLDGVVLQMTLARAKPDFNHPLAGKNLHFTFQIVDLRDATAEELAHGHVHGPHGHHH